MSKYNLIDLYEGMSDEEMAAAKEADRLEAHPEKNKIKKVQAMMAKEKESVKEDHQSLNPEIASRIESLLNQPLKKKFLEVGMDLIQDVIDEDPFEIDDVVSHLANELNAYYAGFEREGEKLANIPGFENTMDDLDAATRIREEDESVSEGFVGDLLSKVPMPKNALHAFAEAMFEQPEMKRKFSNPIQFAGALQQIKSMIDSGKLKTVAQIGKAIGNIGQEDMDESVSEALMPRPSLFKGTEAEIQAYYDSLKREYDRDKEEFKKQYLNFSDEDWVEDFQNYVADKALQEHFGRFLKKYQ